ncbi:hypothetical protein [uncultured Aquimarina sp.]|uniref:hypothetical protein n=1 Tax=uncultured Aquimarina sp. TaxID=575652 RepID=UPI002639003D|nr:hypothetical protein [uncultured Aquimarina sp.]
MKKIIFNTIILGLLGVNMFGQSPAWTVNENDFQYTMSFVAFLNIDGQNLESTNDKVAAFVNGECRGVTNLTYVDSQDGYYAFLTVFSNENSETINLKIYNSVTNTIVEVPETQQFEINNHYGDLFQTFSIASPQLNNQAEIVDFGFKDIEVIDTIFDGSELTIYIDSAIDRTTLNATFDLSAGAELFINTTQQLSVENTLDFSNPVQFEVRSEDRSVLKSWKVHVKSGSGNVIYYKKDAVCYAGGAIKVVFPINNKEVVLLKEGVIVAASAISGGETIFDNLEIGLYTIKVDGNIKEIEINQKS